MSEAGAPPACDERVPAAALARDFLNVRDARPTAELVESIRTTGIKDPLVTRPATAVDPDLIDRLPTARAPDEVPDADYLITDGWQRFQAGLQAGVNSFPINVYATERALAEARRSSIVSEWTQFEKMRHHVMFYRRQRHQGQPHADAVAATVDAHDISRRSLRRYLAVFELPPAARELLKPRDDRSEQAWQTLQHDRPDIKQQQTRLPIRVAARVGVACRDERLDPARARRLCAHLLGLDADLAGDVIDAALAAPETDVVELVNEEVFRQSTHGGVTQLPSCVVLDEADYEALMEHCQRTRTSIGSVIRSQLEAKAAAIRGE